MQNKVVRVLLLLFVVVSLSSCVAAPAAHPTNGFAQQLVALPDEGRVLVMTLVTAAVTWLLLQAAVLIKIDLSSYVGPIVAIVAPVLITAIEAGLGTIPPVFDNLVLAVIHVIVLAIGSIGVFITFSRVKNKQVRLLLAPHQ